MAIAISEHACKCHITTAFVLSLSQPCEVNCRTVWKDFTLGAIHKASVRPQPGLSPNCSVPFPGRLRNIIYLMVKSLFAWTNKRRIVKEDANGRFVFSGSWSVLKKDGCYCIQAILLWWSHTPKLRRFQLTICCFLYTSSSKRLTLSDVLSALGRSSLHPIGANSHEDRQKQYEAQEANFLSEF